MLSLVVHGAGSCPETARRLLAPALPPGSSVLEVDARGGIEEIVARLDQAAARAGAAGDEIVLGAGISLGAHSLAAWAAGGAPLPSLLLVMPAWTGAVGDVAASTAAAADDIVTLGIDAVLERLRADPSIAHDWVLDELARGWATYTDVELVQALRAAAASPAPTLDELARIRARVAVVGLADDPLHPEQVARDWARAITGSSLEIVPRHAPAADRGAFGRAGARALRRRAD